MEWGFIVALIIGTLVMLVPIVFVWYMCIGGIYVAIKNGKKAKLLKKALTNLTCTVDFDCPPGYICLEGRCVPNLK